MPVVLEAALQAPAHMAGVVLIDGSQFAPAMEAMLKETFAEPNGFETLTHRWFQEMFTTKSAAAVVASVVDRAASLPRSIGEKLLMDMVRYDGSRLASSIADLRIPVMVIQTTYSNEKRERRSMTKGQTTPYLEMVRSGIPSVRIEIISNTGHFPQIDKAAQTNALLDGFLSGEPIVLATEVPIGSVLRVHTVSGALRTADRPCGPTSPCGSLLAIQEAKRFPSLLPIGYRLPQCRRAGTCR